MPDYPHKIEHKPDLKKQFESMQELEPLFDIYGTTDLDIVENVPSVRERMEMYAKLFENAEYRGVKSASLSGRPFSALIVNLPSSGLQIIDFGAAIGVFCRDIKRKTERFRKDISEDASVMADLKKLAQPLIDRFHALANVSTDTLYADPHPLLGHTHKGMEDISRLIKPFEQAKGTKCLYPTDTCIDRIIHPEKYGLKPRQRVDKNGKPVSKKIVAAQIIQNRKGRYSPIEDAYPTI